MTQPETLLSPWSFSEDMNPTFDQVVESYGFPMDDQVGDCMLYGITMDDHADDCGLSTLLNTPEDNASEVCSIPFPSFPIPIDHIQYPIDEETLQLPSLMELDDFDSILNAQIIGIQGHGYQGESEGSYPLQNLSSEVDDAWSPTPSVMSEFSSIQTSPLVLPQEGMEIDNHVSLPHLMEACVEALEQGQKALAEVILRCISQKVSPLGEPLERFAFYLSQDMSNHGDYLKGEAFKNYEAVLRAFTQGLPIVKIAHFTAISAILEAITEDCDTIHIIDLYMEHGIQWPPIFEAIVRLNKTLKLTSINWGEKGPEYVSSIPFNFEETRRQLHEHAESCGLKLKVEEKGVEELVTEIKKMSKRDGRREFLAFNCIVGLPHMGRVRSRRHVLEFLRVAQDLINSGNRGIITFGDGDTFEKVKNSLNFRAFFDGHLVHYLALLESIESHFPTRFSQAKIAMEQLFLQPCISPLDWLQTWQEMKRDFHLEAGIRMEGCRLSNNILKEVGELLRVSEGSYQARIEGQNSDALVLEWKGTQLLKFSTWRN